MRVTKYKIILSVIILLLNINIVKAEENKKPKEEIIFEDHFYYQTKETNRISQEFKQKYEKKNIYKNQVECEDKLSNINTLECIIVNLQEIMQNNDHINLSFDTGEYDLYTYSDMDEFNKLNYNQVAYYYLNKIEDIYINKYGAYNMYISVSVYLGKIEIEENEVYLLLSFIVKDNNRLELYQVLKSFIENDKIISMK